MIYTLSFTTEQCKKLKELFIKFIGDDSPEVELRFGKYGFSNNFVSSNTPYLFDLLMTKMAQNKSLLDTSQTKDTVYNKSSSNLSSLRKIITGTEDKKQTLYQRKQKIDNVDITVIKDFQNRDDESVIRFSYSKETKVDKTVFDKNTNVEYIRQRTRTSFVFQDFTYDFTVVSSNDGKPPSYEIEAEFNNSFIKSLKNKEPKSAQDIFIGTIKSILILYYFNIHTIFSLEMYRPLQTIINSIYKNIPNAVRPKNINIEEAKSGLIDYAVSNKLEGIGYHFFTIIQTIKGEDLLSFFLKSKNDLCNLGRIRVKTIDKKLFEDISSFNNTVFDTEVFKEGVYAFDVIYSPENIQTKPLFDRLSIASKHFLNINKLSQLSTTFKNYSFQVKKFFYTNDINSDIKNTLKEMESVGVTNNKTPWSILSNNDGIIFQSTGSYNPKKTIYKWKFFSKITIDFLFKLKSSSLLETTYSCMVKTSNTEFKEFIVNNKPLEINVKNNDIIDGIKGTNLNNFVVEVGVDGSPPVPIIHRIRFDKTADNTNFITTAVDTWKDMTNELSLPTVVKYIENIRNPGGVVSSPKVEITTNETKLFPEPRPTGLKTLQKSVDYKKVLDSKGASLLSNFILLDVKSYGNRQDIFNLNDKITLIDANGLIGITSIVLSKSDYLSITTFTTTTDEFNTTSTNLKLYNVNNVNVIQSDSSQTILSYFADIIYIDLILNNVLTDDIINKLKKNCKLLVLRVKENTSDDEINKRFSPKLYIESETIEKVKYKFIAIFTNVSYEQELNTNKLSMTITQNCMKQFRKQYNEAKRRLIEDFCADKNVLDIGFGKGGDIDKYIKSKTNKVFGIEPDQSNLNVFLKERVNPTNKKWVKEHVSLLNAEGQQSDKIVQFIGNNDKIDIITMFFSLSFFYKQKEDLQQLAKTIGTTLTNNGYFIGGFMDGSKIEYILDDVKKFVSPCYEILNKNVTLDKHFGQEIVFNMMDSNTATTQTEYLIYIDELAEELQKYDIYLQEIVESSHMIDFEKLNNHERDLAYFYSFFIFKRVSQDTSKEHNVESEITTHTNFSDHPHLLDEEKTIINIPETIINFSDLKDIDTPDDGNCFFFACLYSLNPSLSTIENVISLRKHLEANFTLDIYENLGNGKTCILNFQETLSNKIRLLIENKCLQSLYSENNLVLTDNIDKFEKDITVILEKDIAVNLNDYIEYVIEELIKLNYNKEDIDLIREIPYLNYMTYSQMLGTNEVWFEEWMMSYIEEQLNINIYIIYSNTEKLHYLTRDIKDNGKINILLLNDDNRHFESLSYNNIAQYTINEIKSFF